MPIDAEDAGGDWHRTARGACGTTVRDGGRGCVQRCMSVCMRPWVSRDVKTRGETRRSGSLRSRHVGQDTEGESPRRGFNASRNVNVSSLESC